MRTLLPLASLLLTGCPTLYPLAELHDDDPDTGWIDSGSADTGWSTPSGPEPPSLTGFHASLADDEVLVHFTATDPQGDLAGGHLEVTEGGVPHTFAIPSQVQAWTGTSGSVFLPVDLGACSSETLSLTGQVLDAEGRASNTASDTLATSGGGIQTQETGDDPWFAGTLTPPVRLCGDSWGSGGAGEYGDIDLIGFTVGAVDFLDYWTFELTWDTSTTDLDLYLLDDMGNTIASSAVDGTHQPEAFEALVFAHEQLYLGVAAWDGPPTDWTVEVWSSF